jgi:hypothetical protein
MLLKYKPKFDHIKCVPLIPTTAELKKLTLARSQVQLTPGINEVTDDEWKVMQVHLKREIAAKVITEASVDVSKTAANPDGKILNLKGVPAKKATALVNECTNPDTLKKWYQEVTAPEVRLAIVEKMKELKVDVPKFTGEDDGDEDDEKTGGKEGGKS